MASTTALLTSDLFLALPEEQLFLKELVAGEVVEIGMANARHELVKASVLKALFRYTLDRDDFLVLAESMFIVSPEDSLVPDISVGLREELEKADPDTRFPGAPLVAIEIVSSESAARLAHKIGAYLDAGAKEVWVFYPEERSMEIHRQDGTSRRLRDADSLVSEALPGFSPPVSKLFAAR